MSLHERFVSEAKEREADVVFIGDSLIQVSPWKAGLILNSTLDRPTV